MSYELMLQGKPLNLRNEENDILSLRVYLSDVILTNVDSMEYFSYDSIHRFFNNHDVSERIFKIRNPLSSEIFSVLKEDIYEVELFYDVPNILNGLKGLSEYVDRLGIICSSERAVLPRSEFNKKGNQLGIALPSEKKVLAIYSNFNSDENCCF